MPDPIAPLLHGIAEAAGPGAAGWGTFALNGFRWGLTEGRPALFIALMAAFMAAVLVAIARKHLPERAAIPFFHPLRSLAGRSEAHAIATLLLETGRPLDAVRAYRQILELDPADPDALYNLGHAYFQLRLYSPARACWRAVRRLEPLAADARTNLNLVGRLLKLEQPAGLGLLPSGSGSRGSGT